jgi:tetratricopeptide (TPR) repeat protein
VYESYLKGLFVKGSDRAKVEERIAYFEQAIRKDPTFAPAYIGLANAHRDLSSIFIGAPVDEERAQVVGAVQKALELDPNLSDAHVLLAQIKQREWHWADAEAEYKRALDLKPNDAMAHLGLADWLMCQGRIDEALERARRGRELDPLGTSGANLGWILFQARRYDDAIREVRSQVEVRPDDAWAMWGLGFTLIAKGQPHEAIPILQKTVSMMHASPGSNCWQPPMHALGGERRPFA